MKKKTIAIIIGGVLFISSLAYIGYKKYQVDNVSKSNVATQISPKNEAKSDKENTVENNNNETSDSYYSLPEGFVTSVKTKEQVGDKNFYQANYIPRDGKFSDEDLLNAKRVVENFMQGIMNFDKSNPLKYRDMVGKYLTPEALGNFDLESQGIKADAGKYPYKKSIVNKIYSDCEDNSNNNYLEFTSYVKKDNIDNYDQKVDNDLSPTYIFKLLKIDGKWKITENYMKN